MKEKRRSDVHDHVELKAKCSQAVHSTWTPSLQCISAPLRQRERGCYGFEVA